MLLTFLKLGISLFTERFNPYRHGASFTDKSPSYKRYSPNLIKGGTLIQYGVLDNAIYAVPHRKTSAHPHAYTCNLICFISKYVPLVDHPTDLTYGIITLNTHVIIVAL